MHHKSGLSMINHTIMISMHRCLTSVNKCITRGFHLFCRTIKRHTCFTPSLWAAECTEKAKQNFSTNKGISKQDRHNDSVNAFLY